MEPILTGEVNIVGAGLAGLSAAITLAKAGISSNLISLQPSERSQSVLAEGGINAALDMMGEHDTPADHFKDTTEGGCFLADEEAVRDLTAHAPETVLWLSSLGVPFHQKDGKIVQRFFGGQKKRRSCYANSATGKALMTALIDEARKYEVSGQIKRFPHHEFLRLLLSKEKECAGVRIRDLYTEEMFDFFGPVIFASGGLNGFFPEKTTGTTINSGDAAAILYAQGVRFSNLEMIQFHPTTFSVAGKRCLVTEAARGEGGRLFIERNGARWFFMEEKYPERGNLMPRDVVSREEFFVLRRDDTEGPVLLDLTGLGKEVWEQKLTDLREEILHYLAIDPAKVPVPVEPGIHYFMGGIDTNRFHETNVKSLYAAGECTSLYHGANRLGGNSLLGAVYGGKAAAERLKESLEEGTVCTPREPERVTEEEAFAGAASEKFDRGLTSALIRGMSIVRSEAELKRAFDQLHALDPQNKREAARQGLAEAMLGSALIRQESRGAHYREDFPETEEALCRMTVAERGSVRL